jgi:ubiquitin carboxyl-terminal hydrolase 34
MLIRFPGHQREGVALAAVQRWFNECARTLDRLTLEEFTSDLEFWENLPIIVERLLHRQHDLNLDVVENFWVFFETFFLDYCRLVLHLVRLDTSVLSRFTGDSDIDPPLSTSRRYLQTFGWVFNSPDTSFYLALHSRYPNQTLNLIARIKCRVQSPPFDAAGALMQYASHVLAVVPKCPQVFSALPCVMVNAVIFYEYDLEKYQIGPSRWVDDMASLQSLYETARAFDKAYQTFVTKKSQLVTSEMSNHILSCLMRSYSFLCTVDPDFIPQLAKDLEMTLPEDTDSEQIKLCVLWTWKFDALKKQVMEGRMELRVIGVETMQSHLVNLWTTQFSLGNNAQFAQHLVDFLRKNKILEYLMSVDSHPQLIARSSNIFGFLIVTGNYDNYITDIIWKAVLDSQDDRTVSEITAMLARTFPMHGTRANALLYLCSKLLEFPLERYDSRIIDLCEQLVPRMQEKSYDRDYRAMTNEDHVDSIPLKLCVRLIRESAGDEDLPAEKKEILQEFGSRQLVMFIKAGLNETDKTETYERCIQDIADMNACTAGSIQVLNALVSQNDARELWKLATDFDLTTLVITELHNFVEKGCTNPNDSQHGFASRVELLRRLIEFAPDTITAELGNIVWKQILMSEKLPHEERQIIWKMAEATLRNAKENPFMERCIHEYLPGVPPKYYSREVLCFAQQSVFYDISIKAPPVVGEDEIISVPGMDRIWNFILTAPPQTIETDAIKFAIDLYLDHGIITRSPRSAVDATHVALVDRCVDQLNSAAAALKPVSTEPSNGDESMKVDNQNGEIGTEELVFSRSLLFLRQLLYGLRTRPRYNSPQSAGNSPPSFAERPLKGEPVNIRYQCFAGSSEAKMVSMTIGELSTAAELVDVLTQKTRFSKFSIIYCGNRLELLQNPTALVKDLKLDQGLLLIRKSPDAHEITLTGPSRSMTAVDKEVLKHFDKLYDLLVLKDELARQVRLRWPPYSLAKS